VLLDNDVSLLWIWRWPHLKKDGEMELVDICGEGRAVGRLGKGVTGVGGYSG
jgi:hypothetical protein